MKITPSAYKDLITTYPVKVTLGIVGQSNEQGNTLYPDSHGTWQRASVSAPSQGITEPVNLNNAGFGSMFTVAAELLARNGIKIDLYNGAVGGASMYMHYAGFIYMGGRSNSTAYRGNRTTLGTGDPGHRGDLIYVNTAVWEATTGNKHLVFTQTPLACNGATYYSDPGFIVAETNLKTAAAPPSFPGSPSVGNTVTDGDIVWTCLTVGARVNDGGNVHVNRYTEDGFDPYYMCVRIRSALMASAVSPSKRFVYFQNGQSDAGVATAIYTVALRTLAQYFGNSPYLITPIFGLSIYYPSQTKANWDLLETSLSNGGIDVAPDYSSSGLTTGLTGAGYHLATPGNAITAYGFYYGQSLYRAFGTSTLSMLQPSDPHVTINGMNQCAAVLSPTLSKIFMNSTI